MPAVWLIIIATSIPGGVTVENIPFETSQACELAIKAIEAEKPEWVQRNTILKCAETK